MRVEGKRGRRVEGKRGREGRGKRARSHLTRQIGCVVTDGESPVVIRSNKRMSKRISMRDSMSEGDRQLKKLFRGI